MDAGRIWEMRAAEKGPVMQDAKTDLRATSEAIEDDAQHLADLEARKLSLDPEDPEVDKLSIDVQELVGTIGHKAAAERELAEEIGEGEATGNGES
jgi:hypothetical protein